MLAGGLTSFLEEVLLPKLEAKYKLSVQRLSRDGIVTFLKRRHMVHGGDGILLAPHPKHYEKLFSLLGIHENAIPKKTPYDPRLDEVDQSAHLSESDAHVLRSCVGILLYMATDLVESQNAIRALSSSMANPTKMAFDALRHLMLYLKIARSFGLLLRRKAPGMGLLDTTYDESYPVEVFSDSN